MRSTIILSGIAALSLIAVGAQAQTTNGASSAPAASTYASPSAQTHAAKKAKHGYNARARDAQTTVTDNYAQTTDKRPGNDAGYLVPFGPPR
jgi:hypothetical protein